MNHIIRHTEGSIQKLTQFVIKYIYSDSKSNTIPEARASRWKQQKKKSLTRIIPDMDSLKNHIKRANYIAYIQMHFSLKNHPSPLDNGWHMENGICLPTRSRLPPLPPNVTLSMSSSGEEDIVHDLLMMKTSRMCIPQVMRRTCVHIVMMKAYHQIHQMRIAI